MANFNTIIYQWYSVNRRVLPWRETHNPYFIWVSEIILQQTRVNQGLHYYLRFIEEFPTIGMLADASEERILKLWQGLGYYTRARNMHYTAKYIVQHCNGEFPDRYESIRKLKGVGDYTAAAIASIAFNQPFPAIDGNVTRVISRYFGVETPVDSNKGKKNISEIAHAVMPEKKAGFHNQALMEFGALQCVPGLPDCKKCPLSFSCFAFQNSLQEKLPVKTKKVNIRKRYFYFFLIENGEDIFMEKRRENDIWKNLYQLPLIEKSRELTEKELLNPDFPFRGDFQLNLKSVSPVKKHILTHQVIFARVFHCEIQHADALNREYIRVNRKDIYKFAVPKLVEGFLKDYAILEN